MILKNILRFFPPYRRLTQTAYYQLVAKHVHAALGNIIEWYDFALYGFFSKTLSRIFFPNINAHRALMITLLVFAVSMMARPIGGLLFGYIGDRYDRNLALHLAITMMIISSCSIGLLPGVNELGQAAPVLLLLARLTQGLSAGGQYGGSLVLLFESAPANQRCQACSLAPWMSSIGALLAACTGYLCLHFTPATWHTSLSWRFPFLLSILGLVPVIKAHRTASSPPPHYAAISFNQIIQPLTLCTLLSCIGGGLYFSIYTFTHTYMINTAHLLPRNAFGIQSVALMASCLSLPFLAKLSDYVGPITMLRASCCSLIIAALPAILSINSHRPIITLVAVVLLILLNTALIAAITALYCALFPKSSRYRGTAVGYNIGVATLGGFTPFILSCFMQWHWPAIHFGLYIVLLAFTALLLTPWIKSLIKPHWL